MGLSASQARFLQLTARKSNTEFQGQQINQQRLALANESAGLYERLLDLDVPIAPSPVGRTLAQYEQDMADYEAEKRDYVKLGKLEIWLQERMCLATSPETQVFHDEDYRYYGAPVMDKITEGCPIFATLDPASSEDRSSCFRALAIVAVDDKNNWFIKDIPFGRWDSL